MGIHAFSTSYQRYLAFIVLHGSERSENHRRQVSQTLAASNSIAQIQWPFAKKLRRNLRVFFSVPFHHLSLYGNVFIRQRRAIQSHGISLLILATNNQIIFSLHDKALTVVRAPRAGPSSASEELLGLSNMTSSAALVTACFEE